MRHAELVKTWNRLMFEGGPGSGHFGHGGGAGGPGNVGGSTKSDNSSFDGKYLRLPGGALTSIPRPGEGRTVNFKSPEDSLSLCYKDNAGTELYWMFYRYDKTWKDGHAFIKWLNKEGKDFKYVGINDE